jgi:hypothetical protein
LRRSAWRTGPCRVMGVIIRIGFVTWADAMPDIPMLRIDPKMIDRLDEIHTDLVGAENCAIRT